MCQNQRTHHKRCLTLLPSFETRIITILGKAVRTRHMAAKRRTPLMACRLDGPRARKNRNIPTKTHIANPQQEREIVLPACRKFHLDPEVPLAKLGQVLLCLHKLDRKPRCDRGPVKDIRLLQTSTSTHRRPLPVPLRRNFVSENRTTKQVCKLLTLIIISCRSHAACQQL